VALEGSFLLGKGIILDTGSMYFLIVPRKKQMKNVTHGSYFNYAGKGNK
jgi:hypothetical protein